MLQPSAVLRMDRALLAKATSSDDKPTPGYMYGEIAKCVYGSRRRILESSVLCVWAAASPGHRSSAWGWMNGWMDVPTSIYPSTPPHTG